MTGTESNKIARRSVTFTKAILRAVVAQRGSSLCHYCGKEHGSVGEHIWPVAWFAKYPQETVKYFSEILGREVLESEVKDLMKSETNCAKSCTRCNFDKENAERNAMSPEARLVVAMRWLNKAKRFGDKTWIARALKVETGKKRAKKARQIAGTKDVFKRAAIRREVRGKK